MASGTNSTSNVWEVPLDLTDFNVMIAFLGGWISLFGLVSYLLKESYYLSEALISLLAGVAFGPHAANFIRPSSYAQCVPGPGGAAECQENIDSITMNFSRLVLGVQLVLAGVQLPSKYLKTEAKPLSILLGPGMMCMWLATSLLVWGLVPNLPFLHALAVGSCITPTDPVLSAVIVKGKFADHNIPRNLQNLIVAESGANDGLGYPFLFFALYLIKYVGDGATNGNAGSAMGLWFGMTWGYVIILSVIYGAVVGWIAKEALHWVEDKGFVDRESFLVFAISLALFVQGTCGLIGTDDVLACFVAGNTFTWDDWFRLETKDDSLQPTIDMLLNVTIFLWYGAVIPWSSFANSDVIPLRRLVPLGILILLLRRLPWIYGLHKTIHQIQDLRQAVFVGFFGPIGVSAVFYLFITVEFIKAHLSDENGVPRSDVVHLAEIVRLFVWFMTVCSVVIHGLSIPLGKIGYLAPRTISRVLSENPSEDWRSISRRNFPIIGGNIIPGTKILNRAADDLESNREIRRARGEAVSAAVSRANSQTRSASVLESQAGTSATARRDNLVIERLEGIDDDTPALAARREIRFYDEIDKPIPAHTSS